ncbi:MAG: ChbG/HpnK family deacetylase [Hyphomicrobiaceae bacterium]
MIEGWFKSHSPSSKMGTGVLFIADDFGIDLGIERAVARLVERDRLSGFSALVTTDRWTEAAPEARRLQPMLAVGLHLNLSLGHPLTRLPTLTVDGAFPPLRGLISVAVAGNAPLDGITNEFKAQIETFRDGVGALPDMIDSHMHVHALPGVREAAIAAIRAFAFPVPPLVRVPADRVTRILRRGLAVSRSLMVASLTSGFASFLDDAGLPRNTSFSGITTLKSWSDITGEFARAMTYPGARHLVICHPGDGATDEIATRRQAEFEALMAADGLPNLLLRPRRLGRSGPIDWSQWSGR